eukprot:scaffold259402_cov17-Prasinocladus_malaysianus.AAC.1
MLLPPTSKCYCGPCKAKADGPMTVADFGTLLPTAAASFKSLSFGVHRTIFITTSIANVDPRNVVLGIHTEINQE